MSIRAKLISLLSILFASAIGNVIFTFLLEENGEKRLDWIVHEHRVLNESKRLLSSMTDAETGQRGYLLTGDPSYLEPYLKGMSSSKQSYDDLLRLSLGNPAQKIRLEKIASLMTEKFEELKLTIEFYKSGNDQGQIKALEIVKQNSGKEIMDELRLQIIEFENAEKLMLAKRMGDFRESRARILAVMYIEIVFFVILGCVTVLFIKMKLFEPINMLLLSASKLERGEKQDVEDILPKDEMGYLLSRFYKVSEVVHKNTQELIHQATHDALTGLPNRTGIGKALKEAIEKNQESNLKMAVFFVDLNRFKQLNDTLGHDAGDAILIETANRLKASLRSDDVVFRLGGDEFVVLLNDISEMSDVSTIVDNILNKFKSPFVFNDKPIDLSLSVGISIAPDDSTNNEELLKFADVAMYKAKQDAEVNYCFFDKSMLKRESDQINRDD